MLVETERLVLRPPQRGDLHDVAAMFAKPEVWWFPFRRGFTEQESEAWVERHVTGWRARGFGPWVARRKDDGVLVGYVGLAEPVFLPEVLPAIEVGYRFDPSWWRLGLATEGASASLRFGFDTLELQRIIGIFEPENERSGLVMRRLGMTLERTTVTPDHGVPVQVYEIAAEAWRARTASAGTGE